ncbi:MAG: A/G-specific adenine glycosylase [Chloroflexota bacterium]
MQTVSRCSLNSRLFRWHEVGRRPLLIREARDPWQVLVAEVMSQQTGIERVGPAWRRFVDRWPTPADLAEAGTHELLAAWSGLGYNRRALALRESARTIVSTHRGRVPATVVELESLPGIGPYTARAVAATAFGVPVAPLDVNVRRVVSRVLGVPSSSPGLQTAADELVSRGRSGRWLDAVMDLASGICTPRAPQCDACPLTTLCASRGIVAVEVEPKAAAVPFAMTTRWLRGRLVAAVTAAPAGTWVLLPERLGHHDSDAVAAAARGLEREGFLDLGAGSARVRQ